MQITEVRKEDPIFIHKQKQKTKKIHKCKLDQKNSKPIRKVIKHP